MRQSFKYIRQNKILLLIILPAFFLCMLVIFPSGSYYCFQGECGYYFWGAHGRDAIWHLTTANVSFNKFPFIAPTFAGENLYGYNYLLDFFIFLLTKLGIPAIISYFKLLPIIWFIFFSSLLIILARKIKDTPFFVSLFLFFSYFAGSFSYLLTLYHSKTIQGSSTLLPQPILHAMSNLEYAFSLLFFLLLLIIIKDKKLSLKKMLTCGVIIFLMLGLKFYGGMISIFLLGLYLVINASKTGIKNFVIYSLIISCFVLSGIFLFYHPFVALKTGSAFSFAPFALVHTITESPNQFYLQSITDARYYLQQFKIGPRLIAIELLNLLIFLLFYLGTRFFGLLYIGILFLRRKLDKFDAVIIPSIFFSILLTITLVQKGVWWNTIQFFFYAIFLSTIYLTRLTYELLKGRKKFIPIIGFMLILLSVPTSYDLIWHFLKMSRPAYLPKEEIVALAFLKKQPEGVVLSPLHEKDRGNYQKNLPLNYYKDSSYVAAFSGKQLYFAEAQTLGVTSISFDKRLKKIQKMDCSILKEVDYVYEIRELPDEEKIIIRCKPKNVKKIYDSGGIFIYSVKH